tara:strand:+ start:255 stop:467 length:213 start_codon:yes stop_codon:yes gene_type:complete
MKKNKIRDRISYYFWVNIVESCENRVVANKVCDSVFLQMDTRNMFGTQQQANWDKESMELALDDFSQKRP